MLVPQRAPRAQKASAGPTGWAVHMAVSHRHGHGGDVWGWPPSPEYSPHAPPCCPYYGVSICPGCPGQPTHPRQKHEQVDPAQVGCTLCPAHSQDVGCLLIPTCDPNPCPSTFQEGSYPANLARCSPPLVFPQPTTEPRDGHSPSHSSCHPGQVSAHRMKALLSKGTFQILSQPGPGQPCWLSLTTVAMQGGRCGPGDSVLRVKGAGPLGWL